MSFCATTAALMALPPALAPRIAAALENARRPSVIWLPFQECTGCTESLTRWHAPTLEGLIFESISLDYQHTIMAAAGDRAAEARREAMQENHGEYLLAVDGSIPLGDTAYSCIAGESNHDLFVEAALGAKASIAIGSRAAFGGIPAASPNPTGAASVRQVLEAAGIARPVVNIAGCPPIPTAITGVLAHYLTFDDDGAGFPIEAGHGCLGCAEPGFWDWAGFYKPLSQGNWGSRTALGGAAAAGAALGAATVSAHPVRQDQVRKER